MKKNERLNIQVKLNIETQIDFVDSEDAQIGGTTSTANFASMQRRSQYIRQQILSWVKENLDEHADVEWTFEF